MIAPVMKLARASFVVGMMIGSPALAGGKGRVWYSVSYNTGKCHVSGESPQAVYEIMSSAEAHAKGWTIERISPSDVIKDANGDIQVNIKGTMDGTPTDAHYFTSKAACAKFIVDNHVAPEAAAPSDIN
jgi:hypothetical protein